MILRPYGVLLAGKIVPGVELQIENGAIAEIRPHTGLPEPFLVSPPFVNAHSHLEYRNLMGKIAESEYWPWIREITTLKQSESPEQVLQACRIAAAENRTTGVGFIAEHTDRPGAAQAMNETGLAGMLFQELITFNEMDSPQSKRESVIQKQAISAESGFPVFLAPHAPYTVDRATLEWATSQSERLSIHVAETTFEREFFAHQSGPIAEFYQAFGRPIPSAESPVAYLNELGMMKSGTQLVHCCDVSESDLELIARSGSSIAHCPRSNIALKCPVAPVRRMLEAGIPVGIGLDSAASSGEIDFFAEIRCAVQSSIQIHEPISAETVWNLATVAGAASLGIENWEISVGRSGELIKIHGAHVDRTADLIEIASPKDIEWINLAQIA